MQTKLNLKLQCFSAEASVPQEVIDRYKAAGDDSPQFRFYTVSHEGNATGKMLGIGHKVQRYTRDIIKKMHEGLSAGVKAFFGHNADSSHTGREAIGEVAVSLLEEVEGKLHQIAGIYIKPEHRDKVLDVASIEACVQCEASDDGSFNVLDVEPITGIALGDGSKDKPGFAGATLLAQVQAFAEKEDTQMTAKEIAAAIRDGGFSLGDIFTNGELQKDPTVEHLMKQHSDKEFNHRKRVEEKLAEEKEAHEALQAQHKELESTHGKVMKDYEGVKKTASKTIVDASLEKVLSENKYGEKVTGFIKKRFDGFDPGDFSNTEELNKKIGEQVSVYAEEAKEFSRILGGTVDLPESPAVPGGDFKTPPEDIAGFANPGTNPFIPV